VTNITNNITTEINNTINITNNITINLTNNITNNITNNLTNNITNNITLNITNNITNNVTMTNYLGLYINYTVNTTTGNITNGSLSGYAAANQKCNLIYAGSHMCTINEVLNSINRNMSNENFTATFRATMGAPGYLANANDCEGLTTQAAADLGSIFVASKTHSNGYGSGSLVSCGAVRAIGCCR
jgi:hypothetical protein